jgi:hypothetical protein
MDENEMIENELENLNIQLEEKNFQLNSLRSNELYYQSEINNLKRQLTELSSSPTVSYSTCDVIGVQFMINNTQDQATMTHIDSTDQTEKLKKINETIFQRLNSKLSTLMNQLKTQTLTSIDAADESFQEKYTKLQLGTSYKFVKEF